MINLGGETYAVVIEWRRRRAEASMRHQSWRMQHDRDMAARLTREQCREIDRRAIEEYGISGLVLMENAGRGCVDVLERLGIDGPVVILCGKGNNAGDGFVIARHLEIRGHDCRVLLLCPPTELRGDAATNFAILQKTNVSRSSRQSGAASRAAPDELPTPTGSSTPCSAPAPSANRARRSTPPSTG